RQSALCREKWDRPDYLQRTIASAGQGRGPAPAPSRTPVIAAGVEPPDPEIRTWPEPAPAVYYGLAGEIVGAIAPHSEADPVALLSQLLAAFGNCVGRSPYCQAEADEHHTNLFLLLVGVTAK